MSDNWVMKHSEKIKDKIAFTHILGSYNMKIFKGEKPRIEIIIGKEEKQFRSFVKELSERQISVCLDFSEKSPCYDDERGDLFISYLGDAGEILVDHIKKNFKVSDTDSFFVFITISWVAEFFSQDILSFINDCKKAVENNLKIPVLFKYKGILLGSFEIEEIEEAHYTEERLRDRANTFVSNVPNISQVVQ